MSGANARALVAILLLRGIAVAQPNPTDTQKAAALYDTGKRHFDIAEYANAIAAWKAAYLLSSEPLLLFNIAQAHRLAGDCAQANRFYLNYKRVQPKPANQAELDSAMKKCAGVAPATGDSTPVEPPVVTGPVVEPPVTTPTPVETPLPQPHHEDVYEDRGATLRLTGLVVGGVGIGAGLVGIAFAYSAKSKSDDVEGQKRDTPWSTTLDDTQAAGKRAQTYSRIFGIGGLAAIAAGTGIYFYGRSKSAVKVDIAVTPNNSQVSLSCEF